VARTSQLLLHKTVTVGTA